MQDNTSEVRNKEIATGFTTDDRRALNLSSTIQGWGADLDPSVRPGVPMDKAPYVGIETLYPDIEPQLSKVEILQSVEHQKRPPVYGTTCPPKGLSGVLRRLAFKSSEGQLAHWLTLLAADRIDMIEHDLADLAKGQLPNLVKEMGLATEWKHNRKKFVMKSLAIGAGAAGLITAGVMLSKKRRDS